MTVIPSPGRPSPDDGQFCKMRGSLRIFNFFLMTTAVALSMALGIPDATLL
jgi:hypothetical protein